MQQVRAESLSSNAVALLAQRSVGSVDFCLGQSGVERLKESGCSKIRLPVRSREAMLINTSGGLAGGDHITITIEASADFTVTSQAAERVYRSLGPAAEIETRIKVESDASLAWLPNETILFDGAALARRFEVSLSENARFTACEAVVLGRTESGETVRQASLSDRWNVHRAGTLIHADHLRFEGAPPSSAATLAGAKAFATILHFADDAEASLELLRPALGENSAASAWNGKLVARLLAKDGFELRKALKQALISLRGPDGLPKTWHW